MSVLGLCMNQTILHVWGEAPQKEVSNVFRHVRHSRHDNVDIKCCFRTGAVVTGVSHKTIMNLPRVTTERETIELPHPRRQKINYLAME